MTAWLWAAGAAAGLLLIGLRCTARSRSDATGLLAVTALLLVLGLLYLVVGLLYVWPFVFLQAERRDRAGIPERNPGGARGATVRADARGLLMVLIVAVGIVLIVPLAVFVPGLLGLVASHAVTDRLQSLGELPPLPIPDEEAP